MEHAKEWKLDIPVDLESKQKFLRFERLLSSQAKHIILKWNAGQYLIYNNNGNSNVFNTFI